DVVPADGLDVTLLVQGLRGDLLLAGGHRDRVEEDALEVGIGVVGEDPERRPHVRRLYGEARADPGEELLHDAGPAGDLPLVPAERDLVSPGDDPERELRLQQAQVLVVPAQEDPEVNLGSKREALGRGLSHAAGSRPPSQLFAYHTRRTVSNLPLRRISACLVDGATRRWRGAGHGQLQTEVLE